MQWHFKSHIYIYYVFALIVYIYIYIYIYGMALLKWHYLLTIIKELFLQFKTFYAISGKKLYVCPYLCCYTS